MNIVAIIQARMGSTRLRGKVLTDLGGQTVLARVVSRVRRATLVNSVVVATTTE
jgi:spore coat polysaccharide biosynthesis protein SpsF